MPRLTGGIDLSAATGALLATGSAPAGGAFEAQADTTISGTANTGSHGRVLPLVGDMR